MIIDKKQILQSVRTEFTMLGGDYIRLYNKLSTNSKQLKIALKEFLMTHFCSVEEFILLENDRLASIMQLTTNFVCRLALHLYVYVFYSVSSCMS
jgi:hypothetical protein